MNKIFGIGLQRTGTTSLHQAAIQLGLRSAPMSTALLHNLRDPLINQYDLFSDNPIPLLYPELDRLYPDSQFILTTRPVEAWLNSVEWLFTVDKPTLPLALQQLGDEIHHRLYGQTTFDREHFRAVWVRYHSKVDAYFADRPDDLLRLDVTNGDGWAQLCPFLGLPIPRTPFPHRNRSRPQIGSRLRAAWSRATRRFAP